VTLVRLDDPLDDRVADDVAGTELDEPDRCSWGLLTL
jgi:hypothetical protein